MLDESQALNFVRQYADRHYLSLGTLFKAELLAEGHMFSDPDPVWAIVYGPPSEAQCCDGYDGDFVFLVNSTTHQVRMIGLL